MQWVIYMKSIVYIQASRRKVVSQSLFAHISIQDYERPPSIAGIQDVHCLYSEQIGKQ